MLASWFEPGSHSQRLAMGQILSTFQFIFKDILLKFAWSLHNVSFLTVLIQSHARVYSQQHTEAQHSHKRRLGPPADQKGSVKNPGLEGRPAGPQVLRQINTRYLCAWKAKGNKKKRKKPAAVSTPSSACAGLCLPRCYHRISYDMSLKLPLTNRL